MATDLQQRVRFVYELETDEVDVFRLAPALTAIGNLVRKGKRTVFPSEIEEVAVRVQPFGEGSFLVDFILFMEPDMFAIVAPDAPSKLTEVLRLIGLIAVLRRSESPLTFRRWALWMSQALPHSGVPHRRIAR